jgi:hypothetical protein
MASRLHAYNAGSAISGASQSGNLAVSNDFSAGGSVKWWNGPDEDLGYVIGYTDTTGLRKSNGTLIGGNAVGFVRTKTKTDADFLTLTKSITGQSFATASVAANWLNTNGYYTSYSEYLFATLASYGVTPKAAFSLRLLSSTYSGPCCRIRRSNDNTETDINFVNGIVDTATINSFVPSGSTGNIVTIYDQTGNSRNRYTSIAIRQPEIKSSAGTIYTQNGRTAVRFNNANHTLQQNSVWLSDGVNYSAFMVYREAAAQDNLLWMSSSNVYGFVASSGSATSAFAFMTTSLNKVNNSTVTISTRGDAYTQLTARTTAIAHYTDFVTSNFNSSGLNFGGYGLFGGFVWDGYYMEEIYCDGSQVSNSALSAAIYQNQKNYYSL